jgi:hypothetical protein
MTASLTDKLAKLLRRGGFVPKSAKHVDQRRGPRGGSR